MNYSKCVHLQSTFKCQILGVPYPWPGATKCNVSIFALGLWGWEYWSKMEILVTYSQIQWKLLRGPGNSLMYMRKQHRAAAEFHRVGDITGHHIVCLGLGESVSWRSWRTCWKCPEGLEGQVEEYTASAIKMAWKWKRESGRLNLYSLTTWQPKLYKGTITIYKYLNGVQKKMRIL